MKCIETDGKKLLTEHGLPVPVGFFLPNGTNIWPSDQPWIGPCMIKAQTVSGRRGKAGLVERCSNPEAFPSVLATLTERLGATPCAGFLCEQLVEHEEEWLVSVGIDRELGYVVTYSPHGGAEAATATQLSWKKFQEEKRPDLPEGVKTWIVQLMDLLKKADALTIEINPLGRKTDGTWIALDAKVELDDSATGRHPEQATFTRLSPYGRALTETEMAYMRFLQDAGHRGTLGNYVELTGDVALILSGGGASLVALDALAKTGKSAANYVELSGNPEPAAVEHAATIVLAKPGIKALWIAGSSANFTDIYETTKAILTAVQRLNLKIPIVIRREGPRADEAFTSVATWAKTYAQPVLFHRGTVNLDDCAKALAELCP